jgi:hypothetical protein
MTKLEDTEKAVSDLASEELARFRAWFDAFDGERFDQRIARDIAAGRLDRLAEDALSDLKAGRIRDL